MRDGNKISTLNSDPSLEGVVGSTFENIPEQIRGLTSFILWKEFQIDEKHKSKSPASKEGYKVAYNNVAHWLTLNEAIEIIKANKEFRLGISLGSGLALKNSEYIWCLDFDGFADPWKSQLDNGVFDFLERFPSYTEASPSGTGFKYFFLTDVQPAVKQKIQFGPSEFWSRYPDIRKYEHREIEVFSKNSFLTLTGDSFSETPGGLEFFNSEAFGRMFRDLHKWAAQTKPAEEEASARPTPRVHGDTPPPAYDKLKLTESSLFSVLALVDHFEEQTWSDVANILARVYGERARPWFAKYSEGDFCGVSYPNFDELACDNRFDRALREVSQRPQGYGVKELLKKARSNLSWSGDTLEYESDSPFRAIEPPVREESFDLDQFPIGKSETKFNFLTTEELRALPPHEWLVKGLIPVKGLASIFGPSKSGKSFLVIHLLASIVFGNYFFGRKTKPSHVIYVALEGISGIGKRLEAYETYHKVKLPGQSFKIVLDRVELKSESVELFSNAIVENNLCGGVIVIDTLAQAAQGLDENSSTDMGNIIKNLQTLQRRTDSLVLFIHHTGKDARRGQRGHSSLSGALDGAIEVKSSSSGREWVSDKVKDGADGERGGFRLEVINLGIDEDGDPVSSCVIFEEGTPAITRDPITGKHQKAIWEALYSAINSSGKISMTHAQSIAASVITDSPRPEARAKESLKALIRKKYLVETDGICEVVDDRLFSAAYSPFRGGIARTAEGRFPEKAETVETGSDHH